MASRPSRSERSADRVGPARRILVPCSAAIVALVAALSLAALAAGASSGHPAGGIPVGRPGALDPIFGAAGVTKPLKGNAVAEAFDSKGRIVVAGSIGVHGHSQIAVARYGHHGGLDPSFGKNGMVTTKVATDSSAGAIAVTRKGKVVVAGDSSGVSHGIATNDEFTLVRYRGDGRLDRSFGGAGTGIVRTPFPGTGALADSMAIDAQGRIVVAGFTTAALGAPPTSARIALARYLPNGKLDPAFGSGGLVTTSVEGAADGADSVTIDPQGRIVAAGYSDEPSENGLQDFAVVRYLDNGALDPSFGVDGKVTTALGTTSTNGKSSRASVAIDSLGKIVVGGGGGVCSPSCSHDFALLRYEPNGSLDTSFGGAGTGTVLTPLPGSPVFGEALAIDSTDGIVLVGTTRRHSVENFAVARYHPDGTLDRTFGHEGFVTTPVGDANAVLLDYMHVPPYDNLDRITVAGSPWRLARYADTNGPEPQTMIAKHPKRRLRTARKRAKVRFSFVSSIPGSLFKCRLDRKPFRTCGSPTRFRVRPGKHLFTVYAISSWGRDRRASNFSFRVKRR
jgi:uncharacterized delta-60 repeat protein